MFSTIFIPAIFITTVIINILISLFVYIRNPKSATHIIFVLLGITISVWLTVHYISTQPTTPDANLFWIRLSIMLVALMELFFLLLTLILPSNKMHIKKSILGILGFITFAVMALALSPYAFTSVEIVNNFPNPKPGPAIGIFGIFVTLSVIASTLILYKRSKKVIGRERKQLRLLMLGILLMNGLMIFTVLLPIALFQESRFVSLAPFYTLLFLSITAYTIIRHRLMDIGLIVARSVAYFLLLVILALIYVGGLKLIQVYLIPASNLNLNLILSVLFTLIIAFTFQPLRNYLEKFTEKVFYRSYYDPNNFLEKINRNMASTLDLTTLSDSLLSNLCVSLKISSAFLILTKNNSINWVKYYGDVKMNQEFNGAELCPLINWIVEKPGESILVYEDMEVSNEKAILQKYSIDVILPLVVKNEIIGAVLLNGKSSGAIYTYEDIEVLKIMAPEVAIAVKNALSYEEIRRFNITLKEEVDKQTIDLQNANERLKQLDLLKDEFVSLASHELRTPMTIIKSYLWMLLNKNKETRDPKEKVYIERAYESTQRLINLVNDMLNVSRIESGRLKLEMVDLQVVDLIEKNVTELIPRAEQLGLTLTLTKPSTVARMVHADPERIEQVMINLIGNSLKFTPKGGFIKVIISLEEKNVLVQVTDSGKGLSPEGLKKLFQKFGTMGGSYLHKDEGQGTGLGLYLSKSLVELEGGKIWAQSEGEGKGATFNFTLPYAVKV